MPVIVVGRERSLAAMDRRLFRAGTSDADMEKLRRVIIAENPEVDFDRLVPGTVLRLPRSPLLKARDSLSFDETVADAVGVTRDQLRADLEALSGEARARLRQDAADRKVLAKQLESQRVVGPASQDDSVMEALKAALEGFGEDAAKDERRLAVIEQAGAEWGDELAALDRLHP